MESSVTTHTVNCPNGPEVLTVGGRWVPLMHACKSINDPACPGQCARRPAGLPSDAPPRIEVGQQRDRSPLPPKPSAQSRMFITALRSSRKRVAFFTGLVPRRKCWQNHAWRCGSTRNRTVDDWRVRWRRGNYQRECAAATCQHATKGNQTPKNESALLRSDSRREVR